jgi:hypothetical protein
MGHLQRWGDGHLTTDCSIKHQRKASALPAADILQRKAIAPDEQRHDRRDDVAVRAYDDSLPGVLRDDAVEKRHGPPSEPGGRYPRVPIVVDRQCAGLTEGRLRHDFDAGKLRQGFQRLDASYEWAGVQAGDWSLRKKLADEATSLGHPLLGEGTLPVGLTPPLIAPVGLGVADQLDNRHGHALGRVATPSSIPAPPARNRKCRSTSKDA